MTNRVTASQVKEIFTTSMSDDDLTAFIDTANLVVTEDLSGLGYSTARLEKIELYLSAHFASAKVGEGGGDGLKRRKIGDGEDEYSASFDMATLKNTSYGQTALMLDTLGGLLADASKRSTFEVF